MHASKRSKRDGDLRIPAAASEPIAPKRGPALRLAVARGRLGIELDAPFPVGSLTIDAASAVLPDIRFPVDLSGGVSRFRHRRGELATLHVALDPAAVSKFAAPRLRGILGPGTPRVLVAPSTEGALVGLAIDGAALAFDVVLAPMADDVRVLVDSPRGIGLSAPPFVLALKILGALLDSTADAERGAWVVRALPRRVLREAFPALGARVPSTRDLELRVEPPDERGVIRVIAERGAAPPALGPRAIAALEAHRLLGEADALALADRLDEARAGYIDALERAPRHVEASLRLAAIDRSDGARAEAALATIVEAMAASDAGPLGAELLEATGDVDGAHDAFRQAATAEPFGPLSALAWLRAATHARSDVDRALALDEAIARAPGSRDARWRRFGQRVARGDVKGALADAEHLEADASGDERFATACRAGRALLEAGHAREARARFERALRYRPARAEGVVGLAEALRDGGQSQRAMDLFARAIELADRAKEPDVADGARVELAELLATFGHNVPAAIARLGEVTHRGRVGCEARLREARLRTDLGDNVGAERAIGRLSSLAEALPEEGPHAARVARILLDASTLLEGLGDAARAEALLRFALRFGPSDREIGRALRRLVNERSKVASPARPDEDAAPVRAPEPLPAEPLAREQPPSAFVPPPLEPIEQGDDDGRYDSDIEDLTQRLRANPADREVATELARLLELAGRDLELLALLSARIDEASEEERDALVAERDRVLTALADKAARDGRDSEADLYRSMRSV